MEPCPLCGYVKAPVAELVRVVQTCSACPSQWDGWTATGDYVYMRYRWGQGTAKSERHGYIAEFYHGDALDGFITLDEFLKLANIRLAEDADVY